MQEARAMVACRKIGISVPAVYMIEMPSDPPSADIAAASDAYFSTSGKLVMERIFGITVKKFFMDKFDQWKTRSKELQGAPDSAQIPPIMYDQEALQLAERIGISIGKMHAADIVHGDLTTSNFMIRNQPSPPLPLPPPPPHSIHGNDENSYSSGIDRDLVAIDFGLSYVSTMDEDKGVDLYVLERALLSTHPSSEHLVKSPSPRHVFPPPLFAKFKFPLLFLPV